MIKKTTKNNKVKIGKIGKIEIKLKPVKTEMKQLKAQHDYVCDNCEKPAEYNVQNWFRSYSIDNDGDFQEINDWEGNVNEFYCKKCAEAEGLA